MACPCNLHHARLQNLVTKKVICDKKDTKHANVGFRNRWVVGDSLIFKGADIDMHYFKKTNFVLSPSNKVILDIVTVFSLMI